MQSCLCMGQVQYIQWQNKAVSTQQNQRSGWGLWGWNLQGTWNYYFLLHSELLKEQGNVWSLLNEFSFTVKSSVSQPIKTLSFAGFFSKSAIRWVFLLYKHQYSGLCFQPSWRLHLRQQRPGNSCLENSHFPPYLIHPQFTGNSHISCIWNLLKSVQIFLMRCSGAHFFSSCLDELCGGVAAAPWRWITALTSRLLLCPPARAVLAAHQTWSVLPAEPSFLL